MESAASRPPPVAIIGAEDEEFENEMEQPAGPRPCPFGSMRSLRSRPAHLLTFLHHLLLQLDPRPALCSLHIWMLQGGGGLGPRGGRKQLQDFAHSFLDKGGLLRVPLPHHVELELERSRLELLPEEHQRRLLAEVQQWQEPELSRQLQDFRSKRRMGLTAGEAELGQLEPCGGGEEELSLRRARERHLAESLWQRLRPLLLSIGGDEEKSAALLGAIEAVLRFLGVRPGGGERKPSRAGFFRKLPIPGGGRKPEDPPRPRRGFAPPWGRDPHGSEQKQSKAPEREAEKLPPPLHKPPKGDLGGGSKPPKSSQDPPSFPPTLGGGSEGDSTGLDPPLEQGTLPPEPPPGEQQQSEEGTEQESLEPGVGALGVPSGGGFGGGGGGHEPGEGSPPPPPSSAPPPWAEEGELEQDPPSWRDIAPPGVLQGLSKAEVKRQEVLNELLQTEQAHVRTLRALLELFYRPLLGEAFFEPGQLEAIFPSLEELLELHQQFLGSLRRLREEGQGLILAVGDVLLARFSGAEGSWFQKLSGRFCSRQHFSLQQLRQRRRRDLRFAAFVQEAESRPQCRRLQLQDLIPSEMQRLTKYPLLLLSIAQSTEDPQERAKVQAAAECCRQILTQVNQEVLDMENLMKLRSYQRRLDLSGLKQSSDPLLGEFRNLDLTKHRLLLEGALSWRVTRDKSLEVQGLLLESLLLLLLPGPEERLQLRCQSRSLAQGPEPRRLLSPLLPLRGAISREAATDPRAFYVISSWGGGAQIYELVAPSPGERNSWCSLIAATAGTLTLPGGPRGKGPRGGEVLPESERGDPKEQLDEQGKEKQLEGGGRGPQLGLGSPEFEGGALKELLELEGPPRREPTLAEEALRRVSAIRQLLPVGGGSGDDVTGDVSSAPSSSSSSYPPRAELWGGGPSCKPPPEEELRAAGDGAESPEGGGAGAPPHEPLSSPGAGGGSLALPPPQAAWLREELQGLEETLRALQAMELQFRSLSKGCD